MKYVKKMSGEKCYLSPISFDDLPLYTKWVNDMETGIFVLFGADVYDEQKELETLKRLTEHNVIMAIVDSKNDSVIGICGLHDRNTVHRSAIFGIYLGDKEYWGKGFGTEATGLMLDFAFNVLNLHSVSLEVMDFNQRAKKSYQKCGFSYVGKKRQAVFIAGQYHDLAIYDILANEFSSLIVKSLFIKATNITDSK